MTVANTALGSGTWAGNGITHTTTGSITPTSNRLLTLSLEVSYVASQATDPGITITAFGLTWVLVRAQEHYPDATNWWNWLYTYRALGPSPSSGTIKIDAGQSMDSIAWSLSEFAGIDTGGTNGSAAVVQSASNKAAASDTCTTTLAAFGSANNATYSVSGAVDTSATARTFTPDSGSTEIHDTGAEYANIGTAFRNDNDTSLVTLASGVSSGVAGMALEIKAATSVLYTQLERGIRGMNRGMNTGGYR